MPDKKPELNSSGSQIAVNKTLQIMLLMAAVIM